MINAFAPAQPRSLSPAWLAKECGSLSQRCPGLPQTFNAGHPRLLFADDLFADDLLRAGDQGGRGGIDRCDDLLRLGALGWAADRKIEPLRLGEELRILHRMIEGRPDDREPIGRHLLRRTKGRPSASGSIRTLRMSLASWLRVRSPTNGTSTGSPGIGSGANLTTGLTFLLLIHSGGTLLQAPQSPSNSPRSIAKRCSALPAYPVT